MIYDFDGTTKHYISKVYNVNGTGKSEVTTIYDNDGTTSHLIFTAENQLFPSDLTFTEGGAFFDDGAIVTDDYLTAVASSSATNGAVSALVDVTNYSKIIFTVSTRRSTENSGSTSIGVSDTQYPSTTDSYDNGVSVTVTTTGTYELDVSGLTGEKYVALSAYTAVGTNTIRVSKIMAE